MAVDDLDFEIGQGQFFSLLGPSGCGKTTTLRMIAGFEFPSSGQILFNDREVTYLKPNLRNAGMVFQNFALFPHMTVFENVAFGLQARKVERSEQEDRVLTALIQVDLGGLGTRPVTQLSGGQQQRVALARAIVIEPEILLLDEPLSNLDTKLREETRDQIKELQKRLGITTIYVTHDQGEALTLSDRIAVMDKGVCQQVGTPTEIYRSPVNPFVARFVGNSNVLSGTVEAIDADGMLVSISSDVKLRVARTESLLPAPQASVTLSIRPESIQFVSKTVDLPNVFSADLQRVRFSGSVIDSEVTLGSEVLRVKSLAEETVPEPGSADICIHVDPAQIYCFDK